MSKYKGNVKKRDSEKHWAIKTIYDSENTYHIIFNMIRLLKLVSQIFHKLNKQQKARCLNSFKR